MRRKYHDLKQLLEFPNGTVGKNPPANIKDTVRSLVQEDPTCRRAAKAHVPPLQSLHAATTENHAPRTRAPQQEKLLQ